MATLGDDYEFSNGDGKVVSIASASNDSSNSASTSSAANVVPSPSATTTAAAATPASGTNWIAIAAFVLVGWLVYRYFSGRA